MKMPHPLSSLGSSPFSTSPDSGEREEGRQGPDPAFPIDVVLRRNSLSRGHVLDFIKKCALKLGHYSWQIMRCRVIVDEPKGPVQGFRRYEVHITIFLSGKTIAAKYCSSPGKGFETFCYAIENSFANAFHGLHQYLRRQACHGEPFSWRSAGLLRARWRWCPPASLPEQR
jgi:hypothetical protein